MGLIPREMGRLGNAAASLVGVGCAGAGLAALGIGCPIKLVTGVSCPGCGMTRAWLSALSLHFDEAFAYHPLFWMLVPALYLVSSHGNRSRRVANALTIAMIAALLLVWVIRLALPDGYVLVHDITVGDVVGIDVPVWLKALTQRC